MVLAIIIQRREWPRLAKALGHPEWLDDERFADFRSIFRNRFALIDAIAAVTEGHTQQELMKRLDAHGVTCGVVAPMGDVVHDEQLRASDILVETGDPGEDYRYTVNSPIAVAEAPKRPPSRAPEIGAHTREIMTEAGYSEEAVNELLASGVLVAPGD